MGLPESARSVSEAIQFPAEDQTIQGDEASANRPDNNWIPGYQDEIDRHGTQLGRDSLFDRVRAFIEKPGAGYLLLSAAQGFGKSGFVAHLWKEGIASVRPVAIHFIRDGGQNWHWAERMLGSLTFQLRRHYSLQETPSEKQLNPSEVFSIVLSRSARVAEAHSPDARVLLLIDGLDEAFGAGRRHHDDRLLNYLPTVLHAGVKIIVTSRPGPHLKGLAQLHCSETVELDLGGNEQRSAVAQYLEQQGAALPQPLDRGFIKAVVSQPGPLRFSTIVANLEKLTHSSPPGDLLRQDPARWIGPLQPPELFIVDERPEHYVDRSSEMRQLLELLLDRSQVLPVAITAALRGAGGYGKTTLGACRK